LPGFGAESEDKNVGKDILQEQVGLEDLKALPEKGGDDYIEASDDELYNNDGYYGGQSTIKKYSIAKLSTIHKIRKAAFSRNIENEKRTKIIKKLYKPPVEPGGGLGGGGLGGPF